MSVPHRFSPLKSVVFVVREGEEGKEKRRKLSRHFSPYRESERLFSFFSRTTTKLLCGTVLKSVDVKETKRFINAETPKHTQTTHATIHAVQTDA